MEPQLPLWYYPTSGCSCSSTHTSDRRFSNNTSLHKRLLLESAYDPVRFSPYFHRFDSQTKGLSKIYSKEFSRLRGLSCEEESKSSESFSIYESQPYAHIKTEKVPNGDELSCDGLTSSYSSQRCTMGLSLCGCTAPSDTHRTEPISCPSQSDEKTRRKGRKRRRTTFTDQQLQSMEKEFDDQKYIGGLDRQYLADGLGLTEKQVQVWFQNRRNKWRRESHDQA